MEAAKKIRETMFGRFTKKHLEAAELPFLNQRAIRLK